MARESTDITRPRGIQRSVMVVRRKCKDPTNKPPPHFCPMLACTKGGRNRGILRYVNKYLHLTKFKYEGLNLIPMLFSQGDYMFMFDLKSGYRHMDIHKDSQTYLGFSWGEGANRKLYVFRVLPFGLASACYVFTKLL